MHHVNCVAAQTPQMRTRIQSVHTILQDVNILSGQFTSDIPIDAAFISNLNIP